MINAERRLKRLESHQNAARAAETVREYIRQGLYYDALTDAQRGEYCAYLGLTREALEQVQIAVCGDLHFSLQAKQRPQPLAEAIAETARMIDEIRAETD